MSAGADDRIFEFPSGFFGPLDAPEVDAHGFRSCLGGFGELLGDDERQDLHIGGTSVEKRICVRPRLRHNRRGASVRRVALGDLTSAAAVEQAMDEYDRLGRRVFLAKYGYSDARWWYVFRRGRRYESKAIAGRAYSVQYHSAALLPPERIPQPLRSSLV